MLPAKFASQHMFFMDGVVWGIWGKVNIMAGRTPALSSSCTAHFPPHPHDGRTLDPDRMCARAPCACILGCHVVSATALQTTAARSRTPCMLLAYFLPIAIGLQLERFDVMRRDARIIAPFQFTPEARNLFWEKFLFVHWIYVNCLRCVQPQRTNFCGPADARALC